MRERMWEYVIESRVKVRARFREEADEKASEAIRQVKEAAHEKAVSLDYGESCECVEPL